MSSDLEEDGTESVRPLIRREGQTNSKNGAGARRAVDFNRAVVIFDDLFRDVET